MAVALKSTGVAVHVPSALARTTDVTRLPAGSAPLSGTEHHPGTWVASVLGMNINNAQGGAGVGALVLVAPGSAQLLAGNRRVGLVALRIWVGLLAVGLVSLIAVLLDRGLIYQSVLALIYNRASCHFAAGVGDDDVVQRQAA